MSLLFLANQRPTPRPHPPLPLTPPPTPHPYKSGLYIYTGQEPYKLRALSSVKHALLVPFEILILTQVEQLCKE